jgi:hypothetical protein
VSTTEARVSQLLAEAVAAGDTARVSQLLAEAVAAGDTARVSQLVVEVIAGPDTTAPNPPTVEVLYAGARIARFRTSAISPATLIHSATQYRVRTADLSQTIWESPALTDAALLFEYLTPEPVLPADTDLVVEARHQQSFGAWSAYGPGTAFRTKPISSIAQPPSWVLPQDASSHHTLVPWQIAASPGADANYVYRIEFRVDGGAWQLHKDGDGELVGNLDITPYPAGTQVEFRALARPTAAETAEPSDWAAGPTITVLALAGQAPIAGPVRLIRPGSVVLEAQPYVNPPDVHTETRWEVQMAGGDWSAPVFDSGFQAVYLLEHTAVPMLDPDTDYEFRVTYNFSNVAATPPSAAYPFRPRMEIIDFTDPNQIAGLPGAADYTIVEHEGTLGGKALRANATIGARTLVFTNLRLTSGLAARFRTPWEWPIGVQPIVLRGMLGNDLQFLFTWDPDGQFGYMIHVDAFHNRIYVRPKRWGVVWPLLLSPSVKIPIDADRWHTIEVCVLVGRQEPFRSWNDDDPPPPFKDYGAQEHPVVIVRLNGQTVIEWKDFGWQAPGVHIGPGGGVLPAMIPRTGWIGIRTTGAEGAVLLDWIAAFDGLTEDDTIPSPTWVYPRPGEPAQNTLRLTIAWDSPVAGEFVFEYEDEAGAWQPLSPQGPLMDRVVDVSAWPPRLGVRVRVKAVYDRGAGPVETAWAVSEPFPVNQPGVSFLDTSVLPSGFPASLFTPIWEEAQDWSVAGQSDGGVIPAQILRLQATPPGGRVSALAYLPVGSLRNAEVLLELRNFSNQARLGAVLCASGTAAAGDWSGYFVGLSRSDGQIRRITRGSVSILQSTGAMALRTGPPWMLLVRRENGVIYAKAWQKHTEPPADWQMVAADSAFESGAWGVGASGGAPGWSRGVRIVSVANLDARPPDPPAWLIGTMIESCPGVSQTLRWSAVEDPMGGVVTYDVGYALDTGGPPPSAPQVLLGTGLTVPMRSVAPGELALGTYVFYVRSCNGVGCSPWAVSAPVSVRDTSADQDALIFYLGEEGANGVYRFDAGYEDAATPVEAIVVPNWVAPGGIAADVLFSTLYLTLTWSTQVTVRVTPMLNGRRLDAEAVELELLPNDPPVTRTFEIQLSEAVLDNDIEVTRTGLRGTWFTFEIRTVGLLGCADLFFEGAELEYTVLRETQPGVTFFAPAAQPPAAPPVGPTLLFGGQGGFGPLYAFDEGASDDGATVEAVAEPNAVAPAGVGGECIFSTLWLAITHRNAAPLTLRITPLVDFQPLQQAIVREDLTISDEIVIAPSPTGWLTEVIEVGLSVPIESGGVELGRVAPRGAWFSFRLELVSPLADGDDLILEAAELEYTRVRESEVPVNA